MVLTSQLQVEVISNDLNISFAKENDIDDIMSFIDSEWKKEHILARDESFFRYEHQNKDQINFVISRNQNKDIIAVLGFIPSAIDEVSDVSTVIWKVSKKAQNPVLGIQLLKYLQNSKGIRTVLSVGINEKTIGIYKYLGMYTDSLKQYVIVNKNIKKFNIAKIDSCINSTINNQALNTEYAIKLINEEKELLNFNFEINKHNIPFKNKKYFIKRYLQHQIYQYDVYGIFINGIPEVLFVTRIQYFNDSKVLRIVDYIGEQKYLDHLGSFMTKLLETEHFEYADFYCFGFEHDTLCNAGFQSVDPKSDELIIPNYFAPFTQKNVTIHFFADTKQIDLLKICKADGDQDRPN